MPSFNRLEKPGLFDDDIIDYEDKASYNGEFSDGDSTINGDEEDLNDDEQADDLVQPQSPNEQELQDQEEGMEEEDLEEESIKSKQVQRKKQKTKN